jgi:hypothetical protein
MNKSIVDIINEEIENLGVEKIPEELYHLTSIKNYEKIKIEGLNPKFAKQGRGDKGIYLTDDEYTAENYAGFYKQGDELILLRINTNGLDYNLFRPDDYELPEFLADSGWGNKDKRIKEYDDYANVPVELSLLWVNQVKYIGIIPSKNIVPIKTFTSN